MTSERYSLADPYGIRRRDSGDDDMDCDIRSNSFDSDEGENKLINRSQNNTKRDGGLGKESSKGRRSSMSKSKKSEGRGKSRGKAASSGEA